MSDIQVETEITITDKASSEVKRIVIKQENICV